MNKHATTIAGWTAYRAALWLLLANAVTPDLDGNVSAYASTSSGTLQHRQVVTTQETLRVANSSHAFVFLPPGLVPLGVSASGVVAFRDDSHYYRWYEGKLEQLHPYLTGDSYEDESGYVSTWTDLLIGSDGSIAVTNMEQRLIPQELGPADGVMETTLTVWAGDGAAPKIYRSETHSISTEFTDVYPPTLVTDSSNELFDLTFTSDGILHGRRIVGVEDDAWRTAHFRIGPSGFEDLKIFTGAEDETLLGVSDDGKGIGWWRDREGGIHHYVDDHEVDFEPLAISHSGKIVAIVGGATVIRLPDGAQLPGPPGADLYAWDAQERLLGLSWSGSGWISSVWQTDDGGATWTKPPAAPVVTPAPWRTELVIPGGTEIALLGHAVADGAAPRLFVLLPARIRVDADRDGTIEPGEDPANPDLEYVRHELPWYYWINDDQDTEEEDKARADIPGQDNGNATDRRVNGMRDLVDFFPLQLDIASLVRAFPPSNPGISYRLRHADAAMAFVPTELGPDLVRAYHDDVDTATELSDDATVLIPADGVALEPAFVERAVAGDGAVLLLEATRATRAPLHLEVWQGGVRMTTVALPLSIGSVEDMFGHVSLTGAVGIAPRTASRPAGANWARVLEDPAAFVFVHGYNVNQQQARGWQAEFFKRMWWSGLRAQFWGVTWHGAESQIPIAHVSPNYQANVITAFGTAPQFAEFVAELRQATGVHRVHVAAHSLGNVVVSSAISDFDAAVDQYFLLNAAVPREAYDGREAEPETANAVMPHSEWTRDRGGVYPKELWAINWWRLFGRDDARRELTWQDRFPLREGTQYFGFYSSGEEILASDPGRTPDLAGVLASELERTIRELLPGLRGDVPGTRAWAYQEKLKGRLRTGKISSSNFGGWGFNFYHFDRSPHRSRQGPFLRRAVLTPAEATMLMPEFTPDVLREDPFFRPGGSRQRIHSWQMQPGAAMRLISDRLGSLYGIGGSDFAARHRDSLLAQMIPAASTAVGRDPVELFGVPITEFNFDMNSARLRPTGMPWPGSRGPDAAWRHSDIANVAYPYVFTVFDAMVQLQSSDG